MDESVLFNNLAISYKEGRCFLFGSYSSLEILSKKSGSPAKELYRYASYSNAEARSAIENVTKLIVLSYSNSAALPDFISLDKCIVISINKALKLSIAEEPILLCEDLVDCKFYELIGNYYISQHKVTNAHLSFFHYSGGGQNTSGCLTEVVQNRHRITLCITDSDIKYGKTKKFQNLPTGNTALAIRNVINSFKRNNITEIYFFHLLNVHEAENLIPISILDSLSQKSPEMKAGINTLKSLINHHQESAILYYDFKQGIAMGKTMPYDTYWKQINSQTGISNFPPISCHQLLSKAVCIINSDCQLTIDSYLQNIWDEIGLTLFTWGCAIKPLSA